MADARDFLLNTDHEMDKIILAKSGDFTNRVEIPHGLSFMPLPFGIWSTDSNFLTINPLGLIDSSVEPSYTPLLGVECMAQKNGNILLWAHGDGAETTKIYYKLFAFAPPEYNSDAPTTANLANEFIINTDYNYRKLKVTGEFTQANQSYTHDLGYLPQLMAWRKYKNDDPYYWSEGISPIVDASYFSGSYILVTPTKIQCGPDGSLGVIVDKIIWRMYYDQA